MKKPAHKRARRPALALAAVLSILLTIGQLVGGHPSLTLSFKVDRSVKPGVQPKTVTLPKTVVQKLGTPGDAETQLAVPTAAIKRAVPGQLERAAKAAVRIRHTLAPLPVAGAAISVPGCRTMFIHSFSSRHGVRPVQFWLHYTASPNVAGWNDVLAVVHYFTTVEASAHFVIDREGHCAYIVPIEQKAWTQMAANAFGINFEIIDRGNEATYLDSPGYAKLSSVLHYLSRVTGIPLQKGAVSGCTPTRYGIVTHWMGGLCSGGHVDLKPFNIDHEIAVLAGPAPKPRPKPLPPCTVRNIQRALHVVVDGVVGPRTRSAIRAFKRAHLLPANSVPGPLFGKAIGLAGCRG